MHIIDHAIQIPVTPSNMWALVSNPENNPKWLADCRAVSFLNSIRRGIGMRWRSQTVKGKDQVVEITAWYEGLGFEYVIVDGARFTSNKGRLRLQEVPEGTIVQWTFSYELGGPLSGLRNALSIRRSLDQNIVESLRNLFRVAKEQYKEVSLADSKALMQDAPNVIERANYKPRHPSVLEAGKPRPSSVTPSREIPAVPAPSAPPDAIFQRPMGLTPIAEPPIAEDDTRPNPILAKTTAAIGTASLQMPDFSSASASQLEGVTSDTTSKTVTDSEPSSLEALSAPARANISDSSPVSAPAVPTAIEASAPPIHTTVVKPNEPPKLIEPPLRSGDSGRLDKRDTATISVFELFGLPRPSMTQEMAAVTSAPPKAASEPAPPAPSDTPLILSEPSAVPTSEIAEPTLEPAAAVEEPPLLPSVETSAEAPTASPLPTVMPMDALPFDSSDVSIVLPSSLTDAAAPYPAPLADTNRLKRSGLRRRLRRQLIDVRSTQ